MHCISELVLFADDDDDKSDSEDIRFKDIARHRAAKFAKKNPKRGKETQDEYVARLEKIGLNAVKDQAKEAGTTEEDWKRQAQKHSEEFRTKWRAAVRTSYIDQGGKQDLRPHSITEHRDGAAGVREYKVRYYSKGYVMPEPAWKTADYCLQFIGLVENYMAVSITPCRTVIDMP